MGNGYCDQRGGTFDGAQAAASPRPGRVNLVGVGFEGTACFRKGTGVAPAAIRRVSADIETYSPYLDLATDEIAPYYDLGDLVLEHSGDAQKDWDSAVRSFASLAADADPSARFLAFGGEHSISCLFIERCLALHPDLLLLHLDAHADLRDGYQGFAYSHAAAIRRCLDHFGSGHALAQLGIRSGTREEFEWMRANKTLSPGLPEFLAMLAKIPRERPLYLTLDLDYFDPAFLPGTGTPEAGGQDFASFIEIVRILRNKNLIGADVVELAPPIDPTGNSDVFAAKVARELLLAMHREDEHVA